MSSEAVASCCASCGIAEIDDVKLKGCDACDLVRYCSDECQRDDKSQHDGACKKRAAELRDELLFKQPESTHLGDCPICYIPLPPDLDKCTAYNCCSKLVCDGCHCSNLVREKKDSLVPSCQFCRNKENPKTAEESDKLRMKRVKTNDPLALNLQGLRQYGKGDHSGAFDYFTKAVEMGDVEAKYNLSLLYHKGEGVEKDTGKETYHLEEAAVWGHPKARYNLGVIEVNKGNFERGVKHFSIAARLGEDHSMKALMGAFKGGYVSKDDLAATLRAHHAAVDAFKSPQRDAAEELAMMMERQSLM